MSLNFAFCRELYISVSRLRAIMLCPITDTLIYINDFEFCILQSIIYIIVSSTCHNVMCRLDPHKTGMLSMLSMLLLAASDQSEQPSSMQPEQPSPAPEYNERHGPAGDTGEAESLDPGKVVHDHDADTNQNPTAGECSFMARIPHKAVGPIYIRRVIPEHVKDPGRLSISVGY